MNDNQIARILADLKGRGIDAYRTHLGYIEACGTRLAWDGSEVEHWYTLANETQVREFLAVR